MRKIVCISLIAMASTAFAADSFQVEGALQEVKMFDGTTVFRILSKDGNAYQMQKKEAKKFGKCKIGSFEIVGNDPVAPRYYILVDGDCQKR